MFAGDETLAYVAAVAAAGAVAMTRFPRSASYVLVGAVVAAVLSEYERTTRGDAAPTTTSHAATHHGPVHRAARIAATAPKESSSSMSGSCTRTTSTPLLGADAPASKVVTLTGPAMEEQKQERLRSWQMSHRELVHPPAQQTNAMLDAFHLDHERLYAGRKDAFIEYDDEEEEEQQEPRVSAPSA